MEMFLSLYPAHHSCKQTVKRMFLWKHAIETNILEVEIHLLQPTLIFSKQIVHFINKCEIHYVMSLHYSVIIIIIIIIIMQKYF
jgi:hypothetical protein